MGSCEKSRIRISFHSFVPLDLGLALFPFKIPSASTTLLATSQPHMTPEIIILNQPPIRRPPLPLLQAALQVKLELAE